LKNPFETSSEALKSIDTILRSVLAGALLALLPVACQTAPPRPRTPLQLSLEALEKAGVKAFEEGRFPSALRYFHEAEAVARSTDNLVAVANAHNNLGAVLKEMGETEKAVSAFERAMRINKIQNAELHRGINLANLASLEIDRKKPSLARAQEYNRLAATLFEKCDFPVGSILVRNNEGRILLKQGKVEKAREMFEDALSDADEESTLRLRAVLISNLGKIAEDLGNLDAALLKYREALDLDRELEVFTGVARSLEAVARVQAKKGSKSEASRSLLRAFDVVLLRVQWEPWIRRLLRENEKLLKELGRTKEASELRISAEDEMERARKERERLERSRVHEPLGDVD